MATCDSIQYGGRAYNYVLSVTMEMRKIFSRVVITVHCSSTEDEHTLCGYISI